MTENCCAYCRHWEAGTLSLSARIKAREAGKTYPCHVHQPAEYPGCSVCSYFEEAKLHE